MSNFVILDIPTIVGQSTVDGFKDKLEVLSFSYGVGIPITSGVSNSERTSGRPHFQDFTLTRYSDSATPQLMQATAGGSVLKGETKITIARNDEKGAVLPLMIFTLTDVVVANVSLSGGSGDLPVETISLNYTKIKLEYSVQKTDGGKEGVTPFQFNIATNKSA
jgi:type VI secretion system secreted protein Hcp